MGTWSGMPERSALIAPELAAADAQIAPLPGDLGSHLGQEVHELAVALAASRATGRRAITSPPVSAAAAAG